MKNVFKTIYYSLKYSGLTKESIVDLIEGKFKESQTKEISDYLIESFDYSTDKINLLIYAKNMIKHYSGLEISTEAIKKHRERVQTVIDKLNTL